MLQVLWDTRQYLFWLIVISLGCLLAERIRPWRAGQRMLRPQFAQDLFWLVFNGHYFGLLLAHLAGYLAPLAAPVLHSAKALNLLASQPLALQFLGYFLLKDFLEWCIHNLLHRIPALWEIHKMHHSIVDMDWIGNFRFHWLESVIYQGLTYLPLVLLGVDPTVLLLVAIAGTVIGHLNHSNLDLTYGPLRYLFNSPRMHIWHHAAETPPGRPAGANFGTSLSIWDWIFRTAYWPTRETAPTQQPERLGFRGLGHFPKSLARRFIHPLLHWWRR